MDYMPVYFWLLIALAGVVLAVVWLFVPFAVLRQARIQQALLNEVQALRRELAARKAP